MKNQFSHAMVEFVDIFPTLSELCGLDIPVTVEGKSLVPLLKDPATDWTDHVICKYHDGLTIRTSEYSYTEWRNAEDSLISYMLFDHNSDKDETNNLAADPAYKSIEEELSEKLRENKGENYYTENDITQP